MGSDKKISFNEWVLTCKLNELEQNNFLKMHLHKKNNEFENNLWLSSIIKKTDKSNNWSVTPAISNFQFKSPDIMTSKI